MQFKRLEYYIQGAPDHVFEEGYNITDVAACRRREGTLFWINTNYSFILCQSNGMQFKYLCRASRAVVNSDHLGKVWNKFSMGRMWVGPVLRLPVTEAWFIALLFWAQLECQDGSSMNDQCTPYLVPHNFKKTLHVTLQKHVLSRWSFDSQGFVFVFSEDLVIRLQSKPLKKDDKKKEERNNAGVF